MFLVGRIAWRPGLGCWKRLGGMLGLVARSGLGLGIESLWVGLMRIIGAQTEGLWDGFRVQGVIRNGRIRGLGGKVFWGVEWSIVVSGLPELSSSSCTNANLLGDSLTHRFMGKEGRKAEGDPEVIKSITPESFSTVDWSSLRVSSKAGILEASICSILISLARSKTSGFVDLQSSRVLGHSH